MTEKAAPKVEDTDSVQVVTENEPAKDSTKGVQVSATIPTELHDKLKDIRWDQRLEKMTDVFRKALDEFASKHHSPKA